MAHSKRILSLLVIALSSLQAADPPKPKVRAITGFVTIDAKSYPRQIEETVTFLHKVRDAVEAAGYEVAGIRISTQPFPEYTRGLSRAEALKLLHGIDDLANKLQFRPNIGPAMTGDGDDTASVALLIESPSAKKISITSADTASAVAPEPSGSVTAAAPFTRPSVHDPLSC